uniref:Retrotransposon gag domain-containing protein n=1 Tax=Chromera velia CCMP2878 TaxID=1169474 RepID=A0A0G4HML0_9ALVE|eukprot:Cvel_29205.t1-p1 / transcript=Cvel_29205.t1 / gene=Cvel_29205 / organism=Chromera_velia_CCMP2878 / gene_product=hypothetical protein / transcript_product=hypothetical protein / location=Cvel_scaffold3954:328-5371(-) / protein_length=426 / sequence_SO=supercontig / SO=protein_coding / is_pseudo=false
MAVCVLSTTAAGLIERLNDYFHRRAARQILSFVEEALGPELFARLKQNASRLVLQQDGSYGTGVFHDRTKGALETAEPCCIYWGELLVSSTVVSNDVGTSGHALSIEFRGKQLLSQLKQVPSSPPSVLISSSFLSPLCDRAGQLYTCNGLTEEQVDQFCSRLYNNQADQLLFRQLFSGSLVNDYSVQGELRNGRTGQLSGPIITCGLVERNQLYYETLPDRKNFPFALLKSYSSIPAVQRTTRGSAWVNEQPVVVALGVAYGLCYWRSHPTELLIRDHVLKTKVKKETMKSWKKKTALKRQLGLAKSYLSPELKDWFDLVKLEDGIGFCDWPALKDTLLRRYRDKHVRRAVKKNIAILKCIRTVSDYNNKFNVEALKLKKAGTSQWDLLDSYIEGLPPAVMFQPDRQELQTLQEAIEKALNNEAWL